MLYNSVTNHPDRIESLARKRAGAKLGWYLHATVYLLVIPLLWTLSLSKGLHWAIYPTLGWGLGLAMHGVMVFALAGSSNLHERMVQAERERLGRHRS